MIIQTIMMLCLTITALALLAALWFASRKIDLLQEEEIGGAEARHAKCIAHVASFIGDEFAAKVLEQAAEDYGSVEGKVTLARLSMTKWKEDGPSMPMLWMQDRAAGLRGGNKS